MSECLNPKVSIIIPIRNEDKYIEGCVLQIVGQIYPKDRMEVLVVDGMSTDGTRNCVTGLIEKMNGEGGIVIKLLDNPTGQRASALNIGIKSSSGDVIVRVDARTIISKDYLVKCVRTLLETGADNVGGVQMPIADLSTGDGRRIITQRAIGAALAHPFGVGNAEFRLGRKSGYVDTVYLGCFKRDVFDRVGYFDEGSSVISEDSDINQRIRRAGGKVYLNKDIVAHYYPRDNIKDIWRLYFRYGGAKAGNLIKNKMLTAWRQIIPPAFLFFLVSLPVLGLFERWFVYPWLSMMGVYLLVDVIVSAKLSVSASGEEFISKRLRMFGNLFLTFPAIHFAWAVGFVRRLSQRPAEGMYWGY